MSRTSGKRGLSRVKVIEIAAELADKTKTCDVTLLSVAKACGVKMPSLYNHVNGQQDLQQSLAVYALERLRTELAEVGIGRSSEDAIIAICGAYRAFAHRHPGLYRAMLRVPEANEGELRAVNERMLQLLLQVLSPFDFSKNDAIHIVRTWRAILHGFVSLEMNGAFRKSPKRDKSFDRMIGLFVTALKSNKC